MELRTNYPFRKIAGGYLIPCTDQDEAIEVMRDLLAKATTWSALSIEPYRDRSTDATWRIIVKQH